MDEIIDGKKFSQTLRAKVKNYVDVIKERHGVTPGLAVILVGEDPASLQGPLQQVLLLNLELPHVFPL